MERHGQDIQPDMEPDEEDLILRFAKLAGEITGGLITNKWPHRKRKHKARRLDFEFDWCGNKVRGLDLNMTFQMNANQTVSFTVAPVDAVGTPVTAPLSSISFTSSDSTVFTVAADPSNPNGGILTGVAAGTATLTATATATETDGTTDSVTGTATITLASVTPPVDKAASLVFTFGTPTP